MMKLDSILIILTFNAIFWSLINSVKNNKDKNELTLDGETSTDNDEAESSVDPQIQKFEEMLNPKPKITKKGTTIDNKEKRNRSEYMKIYYQNTKEKLKANKQKYRENNKHKKREYDRNYFQNNKEKLKEIKRKYIENNREKKKEADRKYYQNNKEKWREYREKMKNKKESLKNVDPKVGNIHFDNNGGTSFVNTQNADFRNKGKLPIVYEESIQFEEGNLFNQEEEECNKGETETYMEEQNQTVLEEPTNINYINQIDSDEEDEEDYLRYLNDKPEDEDEDV